MLHEIRGHAVFILIVAFALGGERTHNSLTASDELEARLPVGDYLSELGNRCNCYFTIEHAQSTSVRRSPFEARVTRGTELQVASLDTVGDLLEEVLPDFHIARSEHDRRVFHLIDKVLLDRQEQPLSTKVDLQYSGVLAGLPEALDRALPQLGLSGGGSNMDFFDDTTTNVDLTVRNAPARAVLTDCVPLEGYNRIIWVARISADGPRAKTVIKFHGPRSN